MDINNVYPRRFITNYYELKNLVKKLEKFEKTKKIERISPVFPLSEDHVIDWFKELSTGNIWLLFYPDFPLNGEWVLLKEKLEDLIKQNSITDEIEKIIKIQFFYLEDFYNFLIHTLKELNIDINFEITNSFIYEYIHNEYISSPIDLKDKIHFINFMNKELQILKQGSNFKILALNLNKIKVLEFKIYFNLFGGLESKKVIKISTYLRLNNSLDYVVYPFTLSIKKLIEILNKFNGKLYIQKNYNILKYKILTRKWILINSLPIKNSSNITTELLQLKQELIKGMYKLNPSHITVIFLDYDDFYNFIYEFSNYLVNKKYLEKLPQLIYRWEEEYEEYREIKEQIIDIKDIKEFKISLISSLTTNFCNIKMYINDIKLIIEGIGEFLYSHNLGYKSERVLENNKSKSQITYTGYPDEVLFESNFNLNDLNMLELGHFNFPFDIFKELVERNNGKLF